MSVSAIKRSVEPPSVNDPKDHSSSEWAREIRANLVAFIYSDHMRDRLTKRCRSTFPRPSDGRGDRGEGKDRLSRKRRSWNMSRIRGKDTTPEKRVRSLLHRLGYRFRLNVNIPVGETLNKTADEHGWTRMPNRPRRKVPLRGGVRGGFVRPDILLPKYKIDIFVDGYFWHRHRGCKNCTAHIRHLLRAKRR